VGSDLGRSADARATHSSMQRVEDERCHLSAHD
jgi:hypothetical protein